MDEGSGSRNDQPDLGGLRADLIYFEPQAAALCGVHALNALLQGPYFSEVELAQIALELDALEHQLMLESGMESVDYLKFVAEESGNVADHGMFSIQVLSKALDVWSLRAIPINNPEAAAAKAEPHHEQAFICNLREHWFTIRQIYGQWWNLNSIFTAPEPLSQFYLSAFLGTLTDQGYSIFVVRGQLPQEPHPDSVLREGAGRWFTPEEARQEHEESKKLKQQGFLKAAYKGVLGKASALGNILRLQGAGSKRAHQDFEGGDDPDLARALAASLAERDDEGASGSLVRPPSAAMADDEDADLAAAIAASLSEHAQPDGPSTSARPAAGVSSMDLAAAIEASLQQHGQHMQQQACPAEPTAAATAAVMATAQAALPELGAEPDAGEEGVVEVGLRLPGGSRHTRRFLAGTHTVGHLAAVAASQGLDMSKHRLALQFPRRVFDDMSQTLHAAGVGHKEMVSVEKS